MGDYEGSLQIQNDDVSMRTELILIQIGGTFGTLRFNGKSFFNTLLGFKPFWVYEATNAIHADGSVVYTSEKFLYLNTIDKIHLKSDVIDGSVVIGSR